MSQRRPQKFRDVDYRRVSDSDDFVDAQFSGSSQAVPWTALALAFVLCFGGVVFLATGSMFLTGHIDVKYADRMWPMLILGMLMFIPGAYHIRVAYCAFRRYPGYSFSDIPQFN